MYFNIINACVPFLYVKNIRYFKGIRILSYILNEFLPILIYCFLYSDNFDLFTFVVTWFFFWSFYEIGYLFNDVVFEKHDKKPSSRGKVENDIYVYFRLILVIRICICIIVFLFIFSNNIVDIRRLISLTIAISAIFTIHNFLKDYRFKLISLIMLGVLRPIYIPYVMMANIDALILIILPSIIVKVLDYVNAKHDLQWNFSHDHWPRFMLHIAWFILLLFYEINYALTFIPIFLLQIFALIKHKNILTINLLSHLRK